MKRFIQGESRTQSTLLPELLDDYISKANPVRVIEVFVDELSLGKLGFEGVEPAVVWVKEMISNQSVNRTAKKLRFLLSGYVQRYVF